MTQTAFRSQLLTFNGDPAQSSQAAIHETDGLLIVDDGKVVAAGPYARIAPMLARDAVVHDLRGKLIVPGFIDTHIHYPQTDMIASPAPACCPGSTRTRSRPSGGSATPSMRAKSRISSSTNCSPAARRARSSTARCTSSRPTRCSRRVKRATCG